MAFVEVEPCFQGKATLREPAPPTGLVAVGAHLSYSCSASTILA